MVNRNGVSKAGVAVLPSSDAAVHDSRPSASGPCERARCELSAEVWATSWLHGDAHRGLSTRRGRCKKAAPCGSLGYARHYPCSPGEDCACAARPIHVLTRTHLNFAACARAGERQHLLHLLAGRSAASYYNLGQICLWCVPAALCLPAQPSQAEPMCPWEAPIAMAAQAERVSALGTPATAAAFIRCEPPHSTSHPCRCAGAAWRMSA